MAIQFPDQGSIDLGRSRITSTETYVPVAASKDDGGFTELAKALGKMGVGFDAVEDDQIKKQGEQSAAWNAKIMSTFGDQATDDDINNTLSPLHPKVRARVSQDYGASVGRLDAQKALEGANRDVSLDVNDDQAFYQKLMGDALVSSGRVGNSFYQNGYMQEYKRLIEARGSADSNNRIEKTRAIQRDAIGSRTDGAAEDIWTGRAPNTRDDGSPDPVADVVNSAGANRVAALPEADRRDPVKVANTMMGLHENADRATIAAFIKKSTGRSVNPAVTPWCAAFVDAVLQSTGNGGMNSNWARDFLKYGTATTEPTKGDIVVFKRGDGGHVGFYMGKDEDGNIKVLGGNQSNSVSVASYKSSDLLGYRKPGDAGKIAAQYSEREGDPQARVQVASNSNVASDAPTVGVGTGTPPPKEPDAVVLDPKVLSLRRHFFGIDTEYQRSGTIKRDEIRDTAAASYLRMAEKFLDPSILQAMPDKLMTQQLRSKFQQMEEAIASRKVTKYNQDRKMKSDKEADDLENFQKDATTRFAEGKPIDPLKDARMPDGRIDPVRKTYLENLQNSSSIPNFDSSVNAANLEDRLEDAYATPDGFKKFFADDPVLGGIVAEGRTPNSREIRAAIRARTDIRPQDGIKIVEKLEKIAQGASLMQDPYIDKAYKESVGLTVDSTLKTDVFQKLYGLKYPTLAADTQRVFKEEIRRGITAARATGNGKPEGQALVDLIERAEKKAESHFTSSLERIKNSEPTVRPGQEQATPAPNQPPAPTGPTPVGPEGSKFLRSFERNGVPIDVFTGADGTEIIRRRDEAPKAPVPPKATYKTPETSDAPPIPVMEALKALLPQRPEAQPASPLQLTSQIKFLKDQLNNPAKGSSRPLGPTRTASDRTAIQDQIDLLQQQLDTLVKPKN